MRLFSMIYILLLAYIIVALLFWGFSLDKQSIQIYEMQQNLLQRNIDSTTNLASYRQALQYIEDRKNARTTQYISEGITSLLLILTGAAVVYSSFRRSIRLSRQQNNFMMSVTHELKSPIAAMKLNLQTLEKYDLEPARRQQLLERCILEANRLDDLCNNMLITSQMEGQQYISVHENLDISALLQKTAEAITQRHPGRILADIEQGIYTSGDALSLQIAVSNLIENALKYSPKEKPVTLKLFSSKEDRLHITVTDLGPGIPAEERKLIFHKFYRIGQEHTRQAKGTGLGLYLTQFIIRRHKGKITVRSNEPYGSVFEITLGSNR